MTLYLFIAAYLSCAVLSYGVLCGRLWREFGKWDRSLTGLAMYGAVFWPVCVPLDLLTFRGKVRPRWYFRSRKPARPVCAYAPPEGTVARKMRDLSLGAPIVRDENANEKMRKLKVDVLGWALESISHSAKFGVRYAVFNDDPGCPEAWAGCEYLKNYLPGSYLMRSEVLPFLDDELRGMGFRCEAKFGGKGSLFGITDLVVEW